MEHYVTHVHCVMELILLSLFSVKHWASTLSSGLGVTFDAFKNLNMNIRENLVKVWAHPRPWRCLSSAQVNDHAALHEQHSLKPLGFRVWPKVLLPVVLKESESCHTAQTWMAAPALYLWSFIRTQMRWWFCGQRGSCSLHVFKSAPPLLNPTNINNCLRGTNCVL